MKSLDGYFGKKICVAVSGGVDSTALLHYLKSREKENGYILSAVHCEHGIRGEESLADRRFVEEFCEKRGIPLHVFSCDCPEKAKREKLSLETAAREFRRECFAALIDEGKAEFIATAHHRSDEAETVLFRLARGTALAGAAGMKEEEGYFIRPFLTWSKEEILRYANENGLDFCVDKTNFETDVTRNKLRLHVLPALEEAVSGASENLANFARLAGEDDELLYELSAELFELDREDAFVRFSEKKPLFTRACVRAMKALGITRDYTGAHLDALFALQDRERGARWDLPCGIVAEKREKGLAFFPRSAEEFLPPAPNAVELYSEKGFDGGRYSVVIGDEPIEEEGAWKVLRADGDKIPKNAVFRFRSEGDWINSFGGRKSLKKFFNEKKTPVKERAFLPLIANGESGEVYVICGVEISEKVKATKETERVIYIALKK